MEEPEIYNLTDGLEPSSSRLQYLQYFPKPPFPAWAPSVTVAVGMLIFLTASFYLRHRKVVKKREILMDYFYIIFQYGGITRKRMVTSLCNTNAISLRELGRSFMISCDSMSHENSCPFYPEDYPKPQNQTRRPLIKKHPFFKSRGMSITKRYRGPFMRTKTVSEDNTRQYPSSFQDMIMKFKARRHQENNANRAKRQTLVAPQFEGCSMSTIHGDEIDYAHCTEESQAPANHNRRRRNAHVLQYDKSKPRFADVVAEVTRRSLGHATPNQLAGQLSPYSGKRNSEPWENLRGQSSSQSRRGSVFHVHGGMLSPSNVLCGSQGYIPDNEPSNNFQSFRNSEPTILVHSPSMDADTSQGWSDIRNRYTNGVVFLKRVPITDGTPGEFYYEETENPAPDRTARASLSKVSYVPSGNMNEYYNCILSPNKEKSSCDITKTTNVKRESAKSSTLKSKRGRLSLGNLAISNFNRRIDMASDSLPEYEPEQPSENKGSNDCAQQHRQTARTTWARFKNVFSGSKSSQSFPTPVKSLKSMSSSESHKGSSRHESTRWQRFLSVFAGFHSLPETKKTETAVIVPKTSNSFPSGLNKIGAASNKNFDLIDLEAGIKPTPSDYRRLPETFRQTSLPTTSFIVNEQNLLKEISNSSRRKDLQRPTTLSLKTRAHSLPDKVTHGGQTLKRFKIVFDATRAMQNSKQSRESPKLRQLSSCVVPYSANSPQNPKVFRSYSFESGYLASPGEYRFKHCSQMLGNESRAQTPGRLEGNDTFPEFILNTRRFRSLSPLPEINMTDINKSEHLYQTSNLETVPGQSLYLTPLENEHFQEETDIESGISICEESFTSFGSHSQPQSLGQNSPNSFGQSCLFSGEYHIPYRSDEEAPCLAVEHENTQPLNPYTFKHINSVIITQSSGDSNNPNSYFPSEPTFSFEDKLPQPCLLTPEQKNVSRSTDSVYYDTVSALGTPSTCAPRYEPNRKEFSVPLACLWRLEDLACAQQNDTNVSSNHKDLQTNCTTPLGQQISDPLSDSIPQHFTSSIEHLQTLSMSQMQSPNSNIQSKVLESSINRSFHITNATSQPETLSTATIFVQHLPTPPAPEMEFNPDHYVQNSINDTSSRLSAFTYLSQKNQLQSLPVPAVNSRTNDLQNTSSDSSPVTSRPCTPSRRHSTPSPTPERKYSGHSGHYSPDEHYMANVVRLPRLMQRANFNAAVKNCATHNAVLATESTADNPQENVS